MSEPTLPYATPADASQLGTGRQVFGVIVRTIGVLLVLYGLHAFLTPAYAWLGMVFDSGQLMPQNYAVEGAAATALGALLVRGGWLVRLAYGRHD